MHTAGQGLPLGTFGIAEKQPQGQTDSRDNASREIGRNYIARLSASGISKVID